MTSEVWPLHCYPPQRPDDGRRRRLVRPRLEILSCEDEARLAFAGASGCCATRRPGCSASSTSAAARPSSSSGPPASGVTWSVSLPARLVRSSPTAICRPIRRRSTEIARRARPARGRVRRDQAPRPAVAYAVGGSASSMQRLLGASLDRETLTRGLAAARQPARGRGRGRARPASRARAAAAGGILLLDAASHALRRAAAARRRRPARGRRARAARGLARAAVVTPAIFTAW